jgi:pseudaminic acid synthase
MNIKDKTYIIAEMSANHAGDFEVAKKLLIEAKNAGADCIKVQTYTADTLTIPCDNKYFKINAGKWAGYTLYDLYKEAAMPWEWQPLLKTEAEKIGLDFLSTAYDNSSVDFLEKLGVTAYKIASFEIVDIPLIEYIASKKKPILLSTGMSSIEEIEDAVNAIRKYSNQKIYLLKCTSSYPASYEDMNLNTITSLKKKFPDCEIGFSDHSETHLSSIIAVSLGAKIVEKHVCLSKDIKTADSSFSLTIDEFAEMVKQIRNTEKALGSVSYGSHKGEKDSMVFRKSIFVSKDINENEIITPEHIRVIRPGYGMKPKFYKDIIGKKIKCDKKRGEPLFIEEIEL